MNTPPRTSRLDADEIEEFWTRGFLRVGRVLNDEQIAVLRQALARHAGAAEDYDLLENKKYGGQNPDKGTMRTMFNLWMTDGNFRSVAFSKVFAGWASQLIGARGVRIVEDNSLYKEPQKGGRLSWHQDQSYYPFPQPNSLTVWIALDRVNAENGAMQMAVGSHLVGERLPVYFDTGLSYAADARADTVREIKNPADEGFAVETIDLAPGEASIHHALTYHASFPNTSDRPRNAYAVRYVSDGATWLGSRRYEFHYPDAQVGLEPGAALDGQYFPLVPH